MDRQERVREALLLDLGAIIFELHRQQRREPELLQAKAAELEAVDDEVRALSRALGEGYALPQLTARGLVAACTACGAIMGVRDRHCPSCGAAAGALSELDAGDEATGEAPPLEEPTYEEEIEVRVGEPASVAASPEATATATEAGVTSNGQGPAPWVAEPAGRPERSEQPERAPLSEPAAQPSSPMSQPPDQTEEREPLVPRAQRTLRAGRRLARTWIEERRSGGR